MNLEFIDELKNNGLNLELYEYMCCANQYIYTENFYFFENLLYNKYAYNLINNIIDEKHGIIFRTYDRINFIIHIYKFGLENMIDNSEKTFIGDAEVAFDLYMDNKLSYIEFQKIYYNNYRIKIENFFTYDGIAYKCIPDINDINKEICRLKLKLDNDNLEVVNFLKDMHNKRELRLMLINYFVSSSRIIDDEIEKRITTILGIAEYLILLRKEMYKNSYKFNNQTK